MRYKEFYISVLVKEQHFVTYECGNETLGCVSWEYLIY